MSKIGILKTSDGTPKSSNRVQFRVPLSVKTTLSEYVKGSDNRVYQETVSLIKDNHIVDEDLLTLLKEVRSLVPILDKKVKLFVQVFLHIPWAHRYGPVVEEYQNFLLDLLAAHNYYVEFAFDVLVKNFRKVDPCAEEADLVPTQYEKNISENVQKVLRNILKVIPLSQHLLIKQCQSQYPYTCLPAREQELYAGNLLALSKHQPSLRFPLLKVIFAKMILLDINSPLEEVIAMEEDEDDDEEEEATKTNDDATTTISASLTGRPLVKRPGTEGMRHPLANTLDRKMVRLFSFIKSECSSAAQENEPNSLAIVSLEESSTSREGMDHPEKQAQCNNLNKQINWSSAQSMFEEIKEAFSHLILPTHGSHHIQFLIFYMAAGGLSSDPTADKGQTWLRFAESFIALLWGRGSNPNISPVERLAALGYLSSFIARSKLLPLRCDI
ncbi:hypothetical protein J437_LFUL005937 [Ladona fulva]|uniref:Uncharacterized protein n=1 Tax=Ladona fulva TaxID=123851 RepID=A0A8K0JZF1_LADFU|nr:hypothetical protein J437_LFUL005937 [Ladona fulva]